MRDGAGVGDAMGVGGWGRVCEADGVTPPTSSASLERREFVATGKARSRLWLAGVAVCLLTVLVAFVLPLYVPVEPIRTVSTSYLAGFNNRVATIGVAAISFLVLVGGVVAAAPEG